MQALDLNDFLLNYRKSGRYVPLPKDAAYRLPSPLQRLLGAARSRPQAIVKLASKLKSADSICHAVEYISRDDTRELRNQDNDVVNGLTEGRAIARAWTEDKLKRKDALRAVMSTGGVFEAACSANTSTCWPSTMTRPTCIPT